MESNSAVNKITAANRQALISLSRVKEENPIVINVHGQKEADHVSFWMGRNTPLHNLMLHYCDRIGIDYESVRFTYDGSRIKPDKTADDLMMEDEDVIDAFYDQTGGHASIFKIH